MAKKNKKGIVLKGKRIHNVIARFFDLASDIRLVETSISVNGVKFKEGFYLEDRYYDVSLNKYGKDVRAALRDFNKLVAQRIKLSDSSVNGEETGEDNTNV